MPKTYTERMVDCSVTLEMEREGALAVWDEELTEQEYAARNLGYVDPRVLARRAALSEAMARLRMQALTDQTLADLMLVLGLNRN